MKCRHCGGNLKTYSTKTTGYHIVRFRKCDHCGVTVKTVEENPTAGPPSGGQYSQYS